MKNIKNGWHSNNWAKILMIETTNTYFFQLHCRFTAGLFRNTARVDNVLSRDTAWVSRDTASHYFRIEYFKERFNYLVPEEINLDPEDPDSQQRLQYISVKETLSILFNDPSIVQEIQKSFEYQQEDENKISDYVHGTLKIIRRRRYIYICTRILLIQ